MSDIELRTEEFTDITDNISTSTIINCSICIDEIDIKDEKNVKSLDCSNKHIFHINCINEWLKVNNICPLCREKINIENNQNENNNQNNNQNVIYRRQNSHPCIMNLFLVFLYLGIVAINIYYTHISSKIQDSLFQYNLHLNNTISTNPPYPFMLYGVFYVLFLILVIIIYLIFTINYISNKYNFVGCMLVTNAIIFSMIILYNVGLLKNIEYYKTIITNEEDSEKINEQYHEYINVLLYKWTIFIVYYIYVYIKYKLSYSIRVFPQ